LRFVPWDKFLLQSGLFPRTVVETNDLELAKRLTQQDVGITIAPRWSLSNEVARGECAVLPMGPNGLYRDWYLAYHNTVQLAGPWRSFLRVCLDYLPRLFTNEKVPRVRQENSPAALQAAARSGR
jgi:DNA-binding transcriptional LysR family regulator